VRLETEIAVATDPANVWAFLWNVERVARCLPGCREVRTITPHERYEALIAERVGPFRVEVPLDIRVLDADKQRRLKAEASGRDPRTGTSLRIVLDLRLEQAGSGSRLVIVTDAEISGRLVMFGHGLIRQKAGDMMTKFAETVRRELEDAG